MQLDISRVTLYESDIEEYLFKNPNHVLVIDRQLSNLKVVVRWLRRQFTVPSGIIDLLGEMDDGSIAVVEVKLGAIDSKAIAQVCRYAYDIEMAASWASTGYESVMVHRVVVGGSIDGKTMYECNALNVHPLHYEASLSLSTSRSIWPDSHIEKMRLMYEALSTDAELSRVQHAWDERFGSPIQDDIEQDTTGTVEDGQEEQECQEE